jgi:hypothetical protein
MGQYTHTDSEISCIAASLGILRLRLDTQDLHASLSARY